ncbi:hypothetical protein SAMN05444008_11974 [Cnuella takakiae]|uniref:Uncharacterized protein n=1 Tax=Cnuella takakiae TaxID=1302690 RepID=A0A1M5HIT7_9BACT|nr:hypothetical protein [Cnuella takakiae]SHG15860.1 hypothetical protein SAMN05444008_11974 [Cnuella takakiae]
MGQQSWTAESIIQKVAGGKAYTLLHLLPGKALPADEQLVNQIALNTCKRS